MAAIVCVTTHFPDGSTTFEEHLWPSRSRREVLMIYREMWPECERFVWKGDLLTRRGTIHYVDHSIEVVAEISFRDSEQL